MVLLIDFVKIWVKLILCCSGLDLGAGARFPATAFSPESLPGISDSTGVLELFWDSGLVGITRVVVGPDLTEAGDGVRFRTCLRVWFFVCFSS